MDASGFDKELLCLRQSFEVGDGNLSDVTECAQSIDDEMANENYGLVETSPSN